MVGSSRQSGYAAAIRMFSRNARLYVVHVIGMDMIHGTWTVLFNLYLLAIGFDVRFVGLRLLIAGVFGAVTSVPAGIVSDRIGRKASFILGDGMGATLGLINIMTTDRGVLLVTAGVGAFFSSLHHVSEPPFMHENSKPAERVHLFSVSEGLRTASAMVGSLIAGFLPLLAAARFGKVTAYRWATFTGLAVWFLSLIPALMLRARQSEEQVERAPRRPGFFSDIKNPRLMAKLVAPEAIAALGGGLVLPLSNIFFAEGLHAHEGQIGVTFALAAGFLAAGAFLAPLLAARMSKVRAVVLSRFVSIPFIVVIALAISGGRRAAWTLPVVGAAWVLRTTLYNMSRPIESAFNMEVLTLRERATLAGLDAASYSGLTAAGAFIGSRLMAAGDYVTPFVAMAALYVLSTAIFWVFFREFGERARVTDRRNGVPVEAQLR